MNFHGSSEPLRITIPDQSLNRLSNDSGIGVNIRNSFTPTSISSSSSGVVSGCAALNSSHQLMPHTTPNVVFKIDPLIMAASTDQNQSNLVIRDEIEKYIKLNNDYLLTKTYSESKLSSTKVLIEEEKLNEFREHRAQRICELQEFREFKKKFQEKALDAVQNGNVDDALKLYSIINSSEVTNPIISTSVSDLGPLKMRGVSFGDLELESFPSQLIQHNLKELTKNSLNRTSRTLINTITKRDTSTPSPPIIPVIELSDDEDNNNENSLNLNINTVCCSRNSNSCTTNQIIPPSTNVIQNNCEIDSKEAVMSQISMNLEEKEFNPNKYRHMICFSSDVETSYKFKLVYKGECDQRSEKTCPPMKHYHFIVDINNYKAPLSLFYKRKQESKFYKSFKIDDFKELEKLKQKFNMNPVKN